MLGNKECIFVLIFLKKRTQNDSLVLENKDFLPFCHFYPCSVWKSILGMFIANLYSLHTLLVISPAPPTLTML